MRKMRRLGRYLIGKRRVVWKFSNQARKKEAKGFTDSDWAGCRRTAKSTSGGAMMIGSHTIKTWSSTQKSITLSSGEAEFVAAVKMSTEIIGLTQLAADWGDELAGNVFVDSSAAIGVARRKGCGKMRHVRVGQLWIQEKQEEGELEFTKVRGELNPADMMTKHVGEGLTVRHMSMLKQDFREGRAEKGLKLV